MIEGGTKAVGDLSAKSKIPNYFLLGFLAILAVLIMFGLIRYIIGR